MKGTTQSTFKFSLTTTECNDFCDVDLNSSLPVPSHVVSTILYNYEQSKSPSKRIIFSSSDIANCGKSNRAKTAPMTKHSELNLHGINLLKTEHQNEEEKEKEIIKESEIANMIWSEADGQNTNFTTPNISRLHTSIGRDKSLLIDSIKVTPLKSNDSDYPFYQTTYLKMAHIDDWDESYQRQLLCDYPQRNASIKQIFKEGLNERKIFKILPKLYRIDSGLYDFIISPNSKKKKCVKRQKYKNRKRNEDEEIIVSNEENDAMRDLNMQKLFNQNKERYICKEEVGLIQNKKTFLNEASSIPYTPRALSMRMHCIGFRKKWS